MSKGLYKRLSEVEKQLNELEEYNRKHIVDLYSRVLKINPRTINIKVDLNGKNIFVTFLIGICFFYLMKIALNFICNF